LHVNFCDISDFQRLKILNSTRILTVSCWIAFIVLGVSGTLLGPLFESLTQRFNMPLENAGIFTSLQWFGVGVGVIIAGRLLDRINARYVLCGGVTFLGVGLLLLSVAPVLLLALLGAVLLGIGYGTLDVGPNVTIASLNPGKASSALNMLNMFYGVGAIIGPQVVNFALGQKNFTLAFSLTSAPAFLLLIPFSLVSTRVSAGEAKGSARATRWLMMLPFASLLFVYIGAEVGFSSWLFTQMTKVNLSTVATATLATSIFWVGLTAGRLVASPLLLRLSDLQLLLLSVCAICFGVMLLMVLPTVESIGLVSAFIVGLGCGPVFPTALAMVSVLFPEARGAVSGVLLALGDLGAVVLPWLQGKIGGGENGGMVLIFFEAVISIALVIVIGQQIRRGNFNVVGMAGSESLSADK
jgi:fucose permease